VSAVVKPDDVKLRPMEPDDVDAVMEVELSAYPYPWTAGIFRDCLQVGYCCWVAEQGELLVGYGVMSVAAGESHILNLCVSPPCQGRGVGRRLLGHLLRLAKVHGADLALLEVRPSNLSAISLYESEGFNQFGVRRNYYPADRGREDALMMAKSLLDA